MYERLEQTAEALRARGFEAEVFATADDAAASLLSSLPAGQAVGIGGCMTAMQMRLHERLRAAGHTVFWHWDAKPEDHNETRRRAMNAPYYICSANALTESGLIVQIDGTGNRVSAMCYGPSTVFVIVGRNKLVSGGYQDAVRRIKQVACPQNARRLGLDTPCATGACSVSACEHSMCHVFLALERAPKGNRTRVLLVDEDLGY